MMTKLSSRLSVLFGALFVLSACGGGGGGGGTTEVVPTEKPATPVLSIGFGIKQLQFSWPAASGASYYRLLENPDGVSGYTQVGGDITTTTASRDIAIYLHDWPNARYMLEACNSLGCTASNEVNTLNSALKSIGYFKSTTPNKLDFYGFATALSQDGNTLAVGAVADGNTGTSAGTGIGTVYLYVRSAAGLWSLQKEITAPNGESGDWFGYSLALSSDGNTLAVGAPNEDGSGHGVDPQSDNADTDSGAAYLFTRSGASWSVPLYIKASDLAVNFGMALDLSDDGATLLVGGPGTADGGHAYLFTLNSGVWSQKPVLMGANTNAGDKFGNAVALSGDGVVMVVGAPFEDSSTTGQNSTPDEATTDAGAVYSFTYDLITGNPVQRAYLKPPVTGAYDRFGNSISIAYDSAGWYQLVVGAPGESSNATGTCLVGLADCFTAMSDNSLAGSGAVYTFSSTSGVYWTAKTYLKASNSGSGDLFGQALTQSSDGLTLAVGAYYEDSSGSGLNPADNNDAPDAGAAYLFTRPASSMYAWSQRAYLKAPNPGLDDNFGHALSMNGDGTTLAVGAHYEKSVTSPSLICASGDAACAAAQADDSTTGAGALYLY